MVVVGGRLVVVVVGAKVVGTIAGEELLSEVDGVVGVAVAGVSVVGVDAGGAVEVDVVGGWAGVVPLVPAPELAPGCSFATTTPISAVAPVVAKIAERVRRRRRTLARSRVSGELCAGLIWSESSSPTFGPDWHAHRFRWRGGGILS